MHSDSDGLGERDATYLGAVDGAHVAELFVARPLRPKRRKRSVAFPSTYLYGLEDDELVRQVEMLEVLQQERRRPASGSTVPPDRFDEVAFDLSRILDEVVLDRPGLVGPDGKELGPDHPARSEMVTL